MTWLLVLMLPTVVFVAVDLMCRGVDLPRLRPGRRGRRDAPPVDVFDTLRLQSRLGCVADEIRHLESDRHVYAKAHRLRAARAAYDDLLTEACRYARVELTAGGPAAGDAGRLQVELELASRGWSW